MKPAIQKIYNETIGFQNKIAAINTLEAQKTPSPFNNFDALSIPYQNMANLLFKYNEFCVTGIAQKSIRLIPNDQKDFLTNISKSSNNINNLQNLTSLILKKTKVKYKKKELNFKKDIRFYETIIRHQSAHGFQLFLYLSSSTFYNILQYAIVKYYSQDNKTYTYGFTGLDFRNISKWNWIIAHKKNSFITRITTFSANTDIMRENWKKEIYSKKYKNFSTTIQQQNYNILLSSEIKLLPLRKATTFFSEAIEKTRLFNLISGNSLIFQKPKNVLVQKLLKEKHIYWDRVNLFSLLNGQGNIHIEQVFIQKLNYTMIMTDLEKEKEIRKAIRKTITYIKNLNYKYFIKYLTRSLNGIKDKQRIEIYFQNNWIELDTPQRTKTFKDQLKNKMTNNRISILEVRKIANTFSLKNKIFSMFQKQVVLNNMWIEELQLTEYETLEAISYTSIENQLKDFADHIL